MNHSLEPGGPGAEKSNAVILVVLGLGILFLYITLGRWRFCSWCKNWGVPWPSWRFAGGAAGSGSGWPPHQSLTIGKVELVETRQRIEDMRSEDMK